MLIKNAFSVGYLHYNVEKNIANKVENLVLGRLSNLETFSELSTDFYSNKIITLDEIKDLVKYINIGIRAYGENLNNITTSDSQILDYWVQDYKQGQVHSRHNHGRSELAAVYWVRANEEAGALRLYNPNHQTSLWYPEVPIEFYNLYNRSYLDIVPNKGEIIIFPSYIDHEVLPGGKNCIRTTIAFNIT